MVIRNARRPAREQGALMTEAIVAVGILMVATLPLASSFARELRALKASYTRALAMEIVDGEMEVLVAGEWRAFPEGAQPYAVQAQSAANLPPGKFVLTLSGRRARLEWRPDVKGLGGPVVREAIVK